MTVKISNHLQFLYLSVADDNKNVKTVVGPDYILNRPD